MTSPQTSETFDILAQARRVQRRQRFRRYASVGVGLSLLTVGAPLRPALRLFTAALAAALIVRGLTERSVRDNFRRLKQSTLQRKRSRFDDRERDLVDEASWESFPASDPPSFGAR